DTTTVVVGKPDLMTNRNLTIDTRWTDEMSALESEGKTVFLAGWDGQVHGLVAVSDVIRPESKVAVGTLGRFDIHTAMITGDNLRTATRIGEELGINMIEAE